jgi:ABC-type glycerol-3-phosphate transport system substrate-binding protein
MTCIACGAKTDSYLFGGLLMTKYGKIILFIVAILLVGCAKDSEGEPDYAFEPPEFVFMTEVVPFPRLPEWLPNIGAVALGEDKVYFTAWGHGGEDIHFITHSLFVMNYNGTGLAELPNQLEESLPPDIEYGFMSISALHIDSEGNLWAVESGNYAVHNQVDGPTSFNIVRKMDKNGTTLQEIDIINILRADGSFHYISAFCVDASGNIYIATSTAIHVLNSQGIALFNLTTDDFLTQLTRLSDGSVAHFFRHPDFSMLQSIDTQRNSWGDIIRLPADAHNVFPGSSEYLVFFNQGVSLHGIEAESGETVLVLNWLDSGVLASGISNLIVKPGGHITAILQAQRGITGMSATELINLSKRPYSELPERITLTLGTYHSGHIIQNAVTRFNMTSATHRIHVIDYSSYNTAEDSKEGLTRLTTEIVAGRVPDILVVSSLPFGNYAARGMFVDLYPFLDDDPVLSRDTILDSLLKEDEIDGKLYRIIPGFAVQTLVGRASILGDEPGWNMDEFLAVIEENPQADLPLGSMITNKDFLRFSLMHTMNDYVDRETGTVNFGKDSFIQLLEFANTFPAESIFSYAPIITGRQIMLSTTYGHIGSFLHDRALLGPGTIFKGFPVENGEGHLLIPRESLAVTARCSDPEGAWSFIRFLLLDDFQRNTLTWSLPANKLVFNERIDEAMGTRDARYITGVAGYDGILNIPILPLSPREAGMIEMLFDNLTIIPEDEGLWDIVSESAASFFAGRMSAQDAARIIQNRASIYVAEQS